MRIGRFSRLLLQSGCTSNLVEGQMTAVLVVGRGLVPGMWVVRCGNCWKLIQASPGSFSRLSRRWRTKDKEIKVMGSDWREFERD